MFWEGYVATEIAREETKRAERQASLNWRTRHMKSRESRVATAILMSILALFVR